jgi:predicted amidophosphoribosyltransferase
MCAITYDEDLCAQCILNPPAWDACFGAINYAYPWNSTVHQLKYKQDPGLAGAMAQLMHQYCAIVLTLAHADSIMHIYLSQTRVD